MELQELTKLVDEYDEVRDARLLQDKIAAQLKREETVLAERLITEMYNNDTRYCAGHFKRVKMTPTDVAKVEDWVSFYSYIMENDATDLLEKRLHRGALADRIEEGEEVPGITYIQVNKLSIGKI